MKIFSTLLAIDQDQAAEMVSPIIDLIDVFLPVILTLVATVGCIWCIVLGVKFAKSTDPQEHQQAKKALVNAIIGFVLIFVLMLMLNIAAKYFIPLVENATDFS
jgi:cell division protein FtsW (lipid II flippase)